MSGLFGMGGSASKTDRTHELGAWGTLSDVSNFGTGAGKTNITSGTADFKDILSGDPTKVSEAIAPQAGAIRSQANQQIQTNSQFGNRSGGTNASNQQISTNAEGKVQDLINTLIPQAAQNLESTGLSELSAGSSAAGELGSQTESARQFDKQQEGQLGGSIASLLTGGVGSVIEGLAGGGGAGDVVSSLLGMFV